MSNFSIHINYPDISYISNSYGFNLEDCVVSTQVNKSIKLVSSTEYSILKSYTGDFWKKLVITNIEKSNTNFSLTYNSSDILISNLPLVINIASLTQSSYIPNLIASYNTSFTFTNDIEYIKVYYYIEDINGTIGETMSSTFQLFRQPCSTVDDNGQVIENNPPSITSPLGGTIYTNSYYIFGEPVQSGNFQYQIIGLNQPTSFSAVNLPNFLDINSITGWITYNGEATYLDNALYVFNIIASNIYGSDSKQFELYLSLDIPGPNDGGAGLPGFQ